jgi:nicotinamidase/pyrazinamidase
MTALIVVDLQNDFFPGGALAVKEGDQVLKPVNQLLDLPFDVRVATKDWHPAQHISFASTHHKSAGDTVNVHGIQQRLWPDHCIAYTPGARFAPGWSKEKIDKRIYKGDDPLVDSYSSFYNNDHNDQTGLDAWLKEKGIKRVVIVGLATEYCVKYSALDALALGYEVYVVKEACRGANLKPDDAQNAFELMAEKGVHIISLKEALLLFKGTL